MSTSSASPRMHAHAAVYRQDRYTFRRRVIRDVLLRPIGFGLLVKPHITGREYIPAAGPTLLIMNHIGAIDPAVVTGVVTSRFVVPMSKVEAMSHPIVGLIARSWGVYPVRRGEVDRQALASSIELLKQDQPVLIAPEGTRQPALSEAKDGMTYVAIRAGATIVPVGLDGTPAFPGTLKRLRRTPVDVTFGRAFRFRTSGQRVPRDELRQMTREAMFQLALLLPEHRRGVYSDLSQMTTDYLEFVT
ncbi:MAG: 1-acyl-sn-glycerol-3-phosphate acyltransferase [Anaerolineae bacterium]|nr:1-acyl-sn-glycerol-3-phosphate acyltransferase [Anaerolineae bacterium]